MSRQFDLCTVASTHLSTVGLGLNKHIHRRVICVCVRVDGGAFLSLYLLTLLIYFLHLYYIIYICV